MAQEPLFFLFLRDQEFRTFFFYSYFLNNGEFQYITTTHA